MNSKGFKHFKDATKEELEQFLNSFDTVFCDVDGVLWKDTISVIDGAPEAIKTLRKLGKKVYFVSNNSTVALSYFVKKSHMFEITEDEILRPDLAIIWYLKKIKFNQEIYIMGTKVFKNTIKQAGFKIVDDQEQYVLDSVEQIDKVLKSLNPNVGAVLVDMDMYLTYIKLQKSVEYIKKNNALLIVGGWDPILPFKDTNLIGCAYFIKAIEDLSGKKAVIIAKPSKEFNEAVQSNIGDIKPERILFIGDSVTTDLTFATTFGYKKLLCLTGVTTKEDLCNWKHEDSLKPDYYVDSMKDLYTVVENLNIHMNGIL